MLHQLLAPSARLSSSTGNLNFLNFFLKDMFPKQHKRNYRADCTAMRGCHSCKQGKAGATLFLLLGVIQQTHDCVGEASLLTTVLIILFIYFYEDNLCFGRN